MSAVLARLQKWYADQCDGTWEHSWGVTIGTLDNPGWTVTIDLKKTPLEHLVIPRLERGSDNEDKDWILCWSENGKFKGVGDPSKLEIILEYFMEQVQPSCD